MAPDQRERLRSIKDFPTLVDYLHDELDWPVGDADFEDLTYTYDAEELGIDESNAAKILSIKRLRPLTAAQPWGIFFVGFEPKRLPVVALRRILGSVAIKKRASANAAERLAWRADDLLFISNFGDGDQRQMCFAHFAVDEAKNDLPTLKVLGWDDRDTPLHLDAVADVLRSCLVWPDDPSKTDAWRHTWRSAFVLRHREVIATSRGLALRLAELARSIRERILTVLAIETDSGPITKLMLAFKQALIHDLDEDDFADMYAQTIAYGLLSARVAHPTKNTADDLASAMPATTPFLRELMETFLTTGGRRSSGLDFDELGVGDVVELLDAAKMEAVLRDFGDNNPQEDPVIHFYELFLREYDSEKRMQRGVFYTPRPVVSFIVQSIHEILREDFGLVDGLADISTWAEVATLNPGLGIPEQVDPNQPFVQILDPATGTGTFLVEIIDLIHRHLVSQWRAGGCEDAEIARLWNEYVSQHLLPRLYGFELLMAPYAIAHLKLGLKLHETGYLFESDERARVYLTNALEPPQDFSGRLAFSVPALAHEAAAVNHVKSECTFTVVLGNPPYAKNSANRSPSAESLVQPYKDAVAGETNVQPLSDDYVKFMAFAERLLEGHSGVLGMITNRSYIAGLIHRGMRAQLIAANDRVDIVDLHGDCNVGEAVPLGAANENVFDITQGVAISFLARRTGEPGGARVRHSEIWGTRPEKYAQLRESDGLSWCVLLPEQPYWFYVPSVVTREDGWPGIDEIFNVRGMGIKTRRDGFLIAFSRKELAARMQSLADADDPEEVRDSLGVRDNEQWSLARMRDLIRREGVESRIFPIQYRPFDERYIWYHPQAIERGDSRWPVMQHLLGGRLCLLSSRQTVSPQFSSAFVVRGLSEMKTAESTRGSYAFPLRLESGTSLLDSGDRLNYQEDRLEGLPSAQAPEDFLAYMYAILHSCEYRRRYARLLSIEFPKIPLRASESLCSSLCTVGRELMGLHLMETVPSDEGLTSVIGSPPFYVEKIALVDETVWLDSARTYGVVGISLDVWDFQVGGYAVCQKWLKERKGRELSADDVEHLQRVAASLTATIRLMREVDVIIERHGGWPDAFSSAPSLRLAEAAEEIEPYRSGAPREDPSETLWSDGTQLRGDF